MQVFFLVALGFALLGVMFALQNIVPVRVAFFTWTFEGSLALVLFVALITGALISTLISVPAILRGRWAVNGLRKQLAQADAELAALRNPAPDAAPAFASAPPLGTGAVVTPPSDQDGLVKPSR